MASGTPVDERLHLCGSAAVPTLRGGRVSVSWPLAVLSIGQETVRIQFSSMWVRKLLGRFTQPVGSEPLDWWSADASELEAATVGPRSVIFRHQRSDYRFSVLTRHERNEIVSELDRLSIKYTVVKHTMPAIFGMTNSRKSP